MKTRIMFLFFATILSVGQLVAQTPQAFKYQAAIRNNDGQMLEEQAISLRISILKGDTLGEAVYTEIHDVITDNIGMVNLCIGEGLPITGGLSDIQWGEDKYFTKVEIDMEGGTNYQLLGTSQLMAVPYALYAENSGNKIWSKTDDGIYCDQGRVGIGTSTPESTLDVQGRNIELADFVFLGRMYSATDLLLGHNIKAIDYENTRGAYVANNWPLGYSGIRMYNGSIQFHTKGGQVYAGEIASNEHMRIVSNGNVGIGTTNPITPLHIQGTSNLYQGREILLVQNNSNDEASHATIKLMSGNGSTSTKLQHTAESYEWEGRSKLGLLGNDGQGLVLQATNEEGEIRFETGGAGLEKERMRITEDGKVGIGATDPGRYKMKIEITADGGNERAIMLLKNKSTAVGSLCNLYISAGESGSTYLNHTSSTYIHQGGKYKSHTILGNFGKGLVFRTGENDEGRVAFEFRREKGSSYTYDEKVSITYEGNIGIGITNPQRKLHINDVMRLEPRSTAPDNPAEGDIYMDSNDHVLKVYDGAEWKSCW